MPSRLSFDWTHEGSASSPPPRRSHVRSHHRTVWQQTILFLTILASRWAWHTSHNTNLFTEFKYFCMKRPIAAWSINQRDQSGSFGEETNRPRQTIWLRFLFLVSRAVYQLLLCAYAWVHTCICVCHRTVSCYSDLSDVFRANSCAMLPLALAPVYHTWPQANQKDNTNSRSTLLITINAFFLQCWQSAALSPSPVYYLLLQSCCVLQR